MSLIRNLSLGAPNRRHPVDARRATPSAGQLMTTASFTSAPEAGQSPRGSGEEDQRPRLVALAAAVLMLLALLATAAISPRPLFLIKPPITRRSAGFFLFEGKDCSHAMAQGNWTDEFINVRCIEATQGEFATCSDTPQRHWCFSQVAAACGARRLAPGEAQEQLAGRRLVFAGDSIARNLYAAMLRLLGNPAQSIVVGHADFKHELEGGISMQFFWAPYPSNLTALLEGRLKPAVTEQAEQQQQQKEETTAAATATEGEKQQERGEAAVGEAELHNEGRGTRRLQQEPAAAAVSAEQQQAPSIVLLSTTLWHLLHITAADDFGVQLKQLSSAAAAYQRAVAAAGGGGTGGASSAGQGPQLLLTSSTETFPNRMKTEDKRQSMTPANVDAYNEAMEQAGLLVPGGPFCLLDLFPLTQHCGEECSTDGVHSQPQVYDAALQLLLNVAAAGDKVVGQRRLQLRRALLGWLTPQLWR